MAQFENPDFISVGSLAKTIGSAKREQSDELEGKTYQLYSDNQSVVEIRFSAGRMLHWKQQETEFEVVANIYPIAKAVYFIDFVNPDQVLESHSFILDLELQIATHVIGTLPGKEEYSLSLFERAEKNMCLSPIHLEWEHLSIGSPFSEETGVHENTTDLVGHRYLWHYTDTEAYEHQYLSDQFYTWYCHSGSEKGLCDTDRCFYFKIRPGIYYFVWIEKIIPTLGMVVEDMNRMKTWGKLYGYAGYEEGTIVNCQMAAEGERLE